MSFDVFVHRFVAGEAVEFDDALADQVLRPSFAGREPRDGFVELITADGRADCYLGGGSLMVNHAEGEAIWDLLVELAMAGGLAIIPIGCPTALTDPAHLADLPDELQEDTAVVRTGAELLALILAS